ncbi:hypothetical protein ACHAW5_004985 [Stephanodiscus triporus]|uniref:Uncharacterized protein n=1 Tax=Stephanodiscus triporus TaxID=2934178 RepID=A0ABD3NPJ8_9STRA
MATSPDDAENMDPQRNSHADGAASSKVVSVTSRQRGVVSGAVDEDAEDYDTPGMSKEQHWEEEKMDAQCRRCAVTDNERSTKAENLVPIIKVEARSSYLSPPALCRGDGDDVGGNMTGLKMRKEEDSKIAKSTCADQDDTHRSGTVHLTNNTCLYIKEGGAGVNSAEDDDDLIYYNSSFDMERGRSEEVGPISAAEILDEANHLLDVTATNSIVESEEMPPSAMPESIPDVLFIQDEWEERAGFAVASSLPLSQVQRCHDDVVGSNDHGIGLKISLESVSTVNSIESEIAKEQIEGLNGMKKEAESYGQDEEVINDTEKNHSALMTCPDVKNDDCNEDKDERNIDNFNVVCNLTKDANDLPSPPNVDITKDETKSLPLATTFFSQKDNHYENQDDILDCITAANNRGVEDGKLPLSFLSSNIKKPSFMMDKENIGISTVTSARWKSNSSAHNDVQHEPKGRILLIRIKRKIAKVKGWRKMAKKMLLSITTKTSIDKTSEIITDLEVFVSTSALANNVVPSPSSMSVVSMTSCVVTASGLTVIGAPVKSEIPSPDLLYGKGSGSFGDSIASGSDDNLPSPPPTSMIHPSSAPFSRDYDIANDIAVAISQALNNDEHNDGSDCLHGSTTNSSFSTDASFASGESFASGGSFASDDSSEFDEVDSLFASDDSLEFDEVDSLFAPNEEYIESDEEQIGDEEQLVPNKSAIKVETIQELEKRCMDAINNSLSSWSKEKRDYLIDFVKNTKEGDTTPSDGKNANTCHILSVSNTATDSCFVKTSSDEEAKKKKEFPKRIKTLPACGIVRSRVSNIQQRIELLSSSSDDSSSYQTYKHPRQNTSSSPLDTSTNASDKKYRSIPIGITKTYNKDFSLPTSGYNSVRMMSLPYANSFGQCQQQVNATSYAQKYMNDLDVREIGCKFRQLR